MVCRTYPTSLHREVAVGLITTPPPVDLASQHEVHKICPEKWTVENFGTEPDAALYALADEYTVCDAWFSSVMGPTWPNRLYLHCASSAGNLSNELAIGLPSLFDRLDEADISSRYYYGNLAIPSMYGRTKVRVYAVRARPPSTTSPIPCFPSLNKRETHG